MNNSKKPWPPLIVAKQVPRLVRWRDNLLTLGVWVFFAFLLDTELELFVTRHLEWLGYGPYDIDANWPLFFERLTPFLLIAILPIAGLCIIGALTLRRRRLALLLPQPKSLAAADQARHAGLDESALIAAREQRIVTVHIDADGRHRIETSRVR
jgi:poly-beta-1,6-N-acetyl-D-glucosamine biosynthesis protein PgaD